MFPVTPDLSLLLSAGCHKIRYVDLIMIHTVAFTASSSVTLANGEIELSVSLSSSIVMGLLFISLVDGFGLGMGRRCLVHLCRSKDVE